MLLFFAALASDLPPLPQMLPAVSSAYMRYNFCMMDAAKALSRSEGSAVDLYTRAVKACLADRLAIEAALDTEAALTVVDRDDVTAVLSNRAVNDHMAKSDATLAAIDKYLEVMFAAHLRNFRAEAN